MCKLASGVMDIFFLCAWLGKVSKLTLYQFQMIFYLGPSNEMGGLCKGFFADKQDISVDSLSSAQIFLEKEKSKHRVIFLGDKHCQGRLTLVISNQSNAVVLTSQLWVAVLSVFEIVLYGEQNRDSFKWQNPISVLLLSKIHNSY